MSALKTCSAFVRSRSVNTSMNGTGPSKVPIDTALSQADAYIALIEKRFCRRFFLCYFCFLLLACLIKFFSTSIFYYPKRRKKRAHFWVQQHVRNSHNAFSRFTQTHV